MKTKILCLLFLFLLVVGLFGAVVPQTNATLSVENFVVEPSNPTRIADDEWEGSIICEHNDFWNGTKYIGWYRGNDVEASAIGFETSTDGVTWTGYANNPILASLSAFVYVVRDNNKYYMFVKQNDFEMGGIYLYNVTNNINPVVMNNGNPVLEASEECEWEYGSIYNVAVEIVGSTWHMLYEAIGGIGYTYSTLEEMNWTAHKSPNNPLFTSMGNPYLKYVAEHNSMFLLAGYIPEAYWTIRVLFASLSDSLGITSSWNWVNASDFIIQESNVHIADPSVVSPSFNSTYPLSIGFNYNQTEVYQIYDSETFLEFYERITHYTFFASSELEAYNTQLQNNGEPYISDCDNTITALSYITDKFTFTVSASSGITSTTKVYVGDKGQPKDIQPHHADGGYDEATKIQTITWTHASDQEIQLIWEIASSGSYSLTVQVSKGFMPVNAIVEINGANKSTNLLGQTLWQIPYGTYDIRAYYQGKTQTQTILLNSDRTIGFNFPADPVNIPNLLGSFSVIIVVLVLASGFIIFTKRKRK